MALETRQVIALDIHRDMCKTLIAKQYDRNTQIVKINCYDNGNAMTNLTDYLIEVKIKTPSHNYKLTAPNYVTVGTNYVEVKFPTGVFLESGRVKIEVVFIDTNNQLSTVYFSFLVKASVYPEDYSEDDVEALNEIRSALDELKIVKKDTGTYKDLAKSYAVGTNNVIRENDATDNAKYYYEEIKKITVPTSSTFKPMGTITFEEIPVLQTGMEGYFYNISNSFVSDDRFKDGGNKSYPSGTNVYITSDLMIDCLSGSSNNTGWIISNEEPTNQLKDSFWMKAY